MKKQLVKTAFASAALALLLASCIKPEPPVIKDPGKGDDTGNGGKCPYTATGTIERCPLDSNFWFINAQTGSSPMQSRLLVPINLPAAYKVNALTVRFDYTQFSDSVMLNCWFCLTPPVPYGRYIRICNIRRDSNLIVIMKPVIYLYPQKQTKVKVELAFKGNLTVTYPDYSPALKGWEVIAQKDGSLKNLADNTEHQYLFWEGTPATPYNFDMKQSFCVKGSDTKTFLQSVLPKLGLTPREYNDMIVFWLPKMMANSYNLVHFATTAYTQSAPLNITPKPDQLIRVFMAYQPSDVFVKTTEPVISTPQRNGFTVVEWGGTELEKYKPVWQNLF